MCRSLNSHCLKQCDKSDIVDTVESKKVKINSIETNFVNLVSKNNTSSTMYELNKSKRALRSESFQLF